MPLGDDSVKIYNGLRPFAHAFTKGQGFVMFTNLAGINQVAFLYKSLESADTPSDGIKASV